MGRHEVSKRVVNPELLGTSVSGRFLRGRAGLPDTVSVAGKRVDAFPFRHGQVRAHGAGCDVQPKRDPYKFSSLAT